MTETNPIMASAKYPLGSTAWFLGLEPHESYQLGEQYDMFMFEHPIFALSRTPLRHIWKSSRALPKLEHESFDNIITLVTSRILVQSMVVESIERSENTGEFVYLDNDLEVCLPEQVLYSTRREASREQTRILKMVRDWAIAQLETNNEMFSMRRNSKKQQNRRRDRRSGKAPNQG